MRSFKPTYLYVKTHNQTGLKYFGKTTKDPMSYPGSGKYWTRHLKTHGSDVTTEIIGHYTDIHLCQESAEKFSSDNDIVNSSVYANLKPETGTDGGDTSDFFTAETRMKQSLGAKKRNQLYWNSQKGTEQRQRYSGDGNVSKRPEVRQSISKSNPMKRPEQRKRMSEKMKNLNPMSDPKVSAVVAMKLRGRKQSPEHSKRNSEGNLGRIWITNGVKEMKSDKDLLIPEGWQRGRLKRS